MKLDSSRDTQLRMFIAVAKAGSLRVAANAKGMTQPALSRHIQALEKSLGKLLFRRNGRGMAVTADGQALLLKIEPLFNELDDALSQSLAQGAEQMVSVRIAAVQTLVPWFIPQLTRGLFRVYPNAGLNIHCDSSTNVVECVERGIVDVGFVYDTAVDSAGLTSTLLFEERLALYGSATAYLDPEVLTNYHRLKLILPPRQYAMRRMVERACGRSLHPFIECDSLELILRLVSLTDGLTILPEGLPKDMVEDRGIVRRSLPAIAPRRLVTIFDNKSDASDFIGQVVGVAKMIAGGLQ